MADTSPLLDPRDAASTPLTEMAEDGNPANFPSTVAGSMVFAVPVGETAPAPIGPGGAYEFTVTASPGERLSIVTMFIPSNDWFYSTGGANESIDLFDADGNPVSGVIADAMELWESGTELDEEPGVGLNQPQRGMGGDPEEAASVGVASLESRMKAPMIADGESVIQVTITPQ